MFFSLSDAALSAFRLWVSWIAVGGSGIGVACAVLTVLSTKETTRRSSLKASEVEASLLETKLKLAESERETKDAHRLATEAKSAGMPRTITQAQCDLLMSVLRPIPKGKVLVKANMLDTEAEAHAKQLGYVLVAAGFEVIEQGYTGIISLNSPGVAILVNDLKNPPPHGIPLQKCFEEVGIQMPAGVAESAEFPKDSVIIWVSRKP